MRLYPIIPAGGSGTRLWPLSRASRPKFLLPLPGPLSMLQATVRRLEPLADLKNIRIITGKAHEEGVAAQLPELSPEQLIIEPMPRGSGPAIGLATALVGRHDPDALIGSFAADHLVENLRAFEEAVRTAIAAAERGFLVTIGIQPTYPETGYGYIRAGAPLAGLRDLAYRVEEFKEKPDLATATRYVASGTYQWNASMFVWRARVLLDEMRRLLPDLADALDEITAAWDTPNRNAVLERTWPSVQDVTIDHGILEHSERVAVVPADMGWSDLGDWHGFGLIAQTPGDSSVAVNCDALIEGASNTVIYGNGRLIAVLGLDNVIVVDTDDAVLVCERTRAQEVRKLVEELRRRGSTHLI